VIPASMARASIAIDSSRGVGSPKFMVPSTNGAISTPVGPNGRIGVAIAGVWHDARVDESPAPAPPAAVAVVGTGNLDTTVRVPRLPVDGENVVGDVVSIAPGGKGVNQAVAAARLGAHTALVACVGDDPAGDRLLAALAEEPGLALGGVRRVTGATGTAFVAIDSAGATTIVSARGANAHLDDEHVHRNGVTIGGAAVVLAQLGVPVAAVRAALEIARSVGTTTVLDPCPPDDITDDLLRLVDVCTPNETEIERLTGVSVADLDGVRRAAHSLLARGCAAAVVTLGARGAYLASEHGVDLHVPAIPVEVVDPTGAGDACCGALAAALARGVPLTDAVREAVVAGALATTRLGAVPSLPTRAEVDARLAE